jgi:hypothetical protein
MILICSSYSSLQTFNAYLSISETHKTKKAAEYPRPDKTNRAVDDLVCPRLYSKTAGQEHGRQTDLKKR